MDGDEREGAAGAETSNTGAPADEGRAAEVVQADADAPTPPVRVDARVVAKASRGARPLQRTVKCSRAWSER